MAHVENPASPLVSKLKGVHLFHFDGAPCAQRVRFALGEKGLTRGNEVKYTADDEASCLASEGTWTSRIVSLVKKDHLTDFYSQIQPNLVVPALVHDGQLWIESMDIIAYLDDAFGGDRLVPTDAPELKKTAESLTQKGEKLHRSIRFVTFRWGLGRLGRLNGKEESKLKELLVNANDGEKLVDFYSDYDNNSIDESVYYEHLRKLFDAFTEQEQKLSDGRQFLTSDRLTMADVLWAMKILRLKECGYPFESHHPLVNAWFLRMFNRPAFQSGVLGKHKALNRVFKFKASIENFLGAGLVKAVNSLDREAA
ncbi:MAG: glutathione S-transferase family protein [Pseudomonadota bacterium]